MTKKIITIIMILLFLIMPKSVNAQETEPYVPPEIIEEYNYISNITCTIRSDNGRINSHLCVIGNSSYDISAKLTLQVQSGTSWANVTSWTDSTHGTTLNMNKYASCTKGKFYRAVCKVVVNGESVQKTTATIAGK